MPLPQRQFLAHRLQSSRKALEDLLARLPHGEQVFPGWSARELQAHIAGWDQVTAAALRLHARGERVPVTITAGIDEHNRAMVQARASLDREQIAQDFRAQRAALLQALADLPDERFDQPLDFPWGDRGSVAYLVEIFVDHEQEHAAELDAWLAGDRQAA